MHKNLYLKNKYLFINNFREILGKNSEGDPEKIIIIIEGTDVMDYKNYLCFVKFNAELKINRRLKIKNLVVNISNIELKDTVKNVNINLLEFKQSVMSLYNTFKGFMSELKGLMLDLDFLNKFIY